MTAVPCELLTPTAVVGTGGGGRRRERKNDNLFTSVYSRFFSVVRSWIRVLGAPTCDPDDIAQNVFLVVHRRLPEFDGENVAGWLYRITANQVRDYKRAAWVRHLSHAEPPPFDNIQSSDPSPSDALDVRRQVDAALKSLDGLNEQARLAFLSFEVAGYTSKEIAVMQGTTANTVYCRLRRARMVLAALASEQGEPRTPAPARAGR